MRQELAAIISVVIISLASLIGIFFLTLKKKTLNSIISEMVSFAVGTMLGSVMIHMLPEISETIGINRISGLLIIAGITFGFIMEKSIHWHHCHNVNNNPVKSYGIMNLLSDGIHNFIDGVLITASFMISMPLGLSATTAVLFHEIPQEIGDFAILISAGFSRIKALLFNLLSALSAVVGALLTLIIGPFVKYQLYYIVPIAAGLFIYVAASDLIPELHNEQSLLKGFFQVLMIIAGVLLMIII